MRSFGLKALALWLTACVELAPPNDAPDAAAPTRDGAPQNAVSQAKRPARPRERWWVSGDAVARRYPAYGVTLHHLAYIYEAPQKDARPIGYMRRGARFRASEEVSRKDCARGWFEVNGGGFVCNGEGYLVDSRPPPYEDSPTPPALSDSLPYRYVKVITAELPQYLRMPSQAEEQAIVTGIAGQPLDAGLGPPATLSNQLAQILRLRMQPGFYVSVDRAIPDESSQRAFLRTVRGGYVRSEQLVEAKHPKGIGVALGGRFELPIAFVYRGGAPMLRLDSVTGELVKSGVDWPLHSAHALTGESLVKNGRRYFVTREGWLLRDTSVRIVDRVARPKLIPKSERWIRVDLDRQTLTAYEGERPAFATLVSSGLADHATPTGIYRLHAKHVTTTMDDNLAADGPYSIEDVPWTMYFLGSYALHAAFWHERFGNQRSHGCVNLAPRDARWLFFWTLPELPSSWHGVMADVGEGTTVVLDTGVPYPIEQGS